MKYRGLCGDVRGEMGTRTKEGNVSQPRGSRKNNNDGELLWDGTQQRVVAGPSAVIWRRGPVGSVAA